MMRTTVIFGALLAWGCLPASQQSSGETSNRSGGAAVQDGQPEPREAMDDCRNAGRECGSGFECMQNDEGVKTTDPGRGARTGGWG